jgi:hypothetical protein
MSEQCRAPGIVLGPSRGVCITDNARHRVISTRQSRHCYALEPPTTPREEEKLMIDLDAKPLIV